MKVLAAGLLVSTAVSLLVTPKAMTSYYVTPVPTISGADEVYGVYLPVVHWGRYRPNPTPTATSAPVPTRTSVPLPTALPKPKPTDVPESPSGRVCNSESPDWRGSNPVYPFCVARDMGWAGQSASVQYRREGSGDWMTVQWDFYGIIQNEIRLEHNTSIGSCPTRNVGTGKGGFRRKVNESGSLSFNVNDLGKGLYKVEAYPTLPNGQVVGHNEVYICVT